MPDILEKEIVFPGVNFNGTHGEDLLNQYRAILDNFQPLFDAFAAATPHGRDYQFLPKGTYEKARDQHNDMILKLIDVKDTVLAIALNINDQVTK